MQGKSKGVAGAAVVCAAMVSAFGCSLLLDTDKLKQGTGENAGSAGSGGVLPDASDETQDATQDPSQELAPGDVTPEASPTPCKEDTDCFFAPGAGDLCKTYKCNTSASICFEPTPYTGPVYREIDTAPYAVTFGMTNIGLPTLLVDGESVYLAAWFDDGTEKNVLFRRYDVGGTEKPSSYKELFGSMFKSVHSTPGMMVELASTPVSKGVGLLLANTPDSSEPCVRHFWMDADMTKKEVSANCVGPTTGYNADATRTAPQWYKATGKDIPMWVQGGELFVDTATVTTLGNVKSFSILRGVNPLIGAILESGATRPEEQTFVWFTNAGSLASLNSIPPGPRMGTSTIFIGEAAGVAASLAVWSHPTQSSTSTIESFQENCTNAVCTPTTFSAPGQGDTSIHHFAPVLSLRKQATSADVLTASVSAGPNGANTQLAFYGQFIHLVKDPYSLNPPVTLLASKVVSGTPPMEKLPESMGQTASVITDGGRVFVVWVERDDNGKAALYLRRYQLKDNCTAP